MEELADSPFFSIIIPVYNVAPYLRECLDSVLAQTFPDWEAICVDDGSTDGSGAILDEYAAKEKRFRVFNQKHFGVSNARNSGIIEAHGEWIGFVDADDVVAEKWLETAAGAIAEQKADFVRMNFRWWDCKRDRTYPGLDANKLLIEGCDAVFEWGWRNLLNAGWAFILFVKASLLESQNILFPEGMGIREDVIFALDIARHSSMAVQLPYDGYKYRISTHSAYRQPRRLMECVRFIDECCSRWSKDANRIRSLGFEPEAKRLLGKAIGSMVVEWLETGNRNEHKHDLELVVRLRELSGNGILSEYDMPSAYRRGFHRLSRTGSMAAWYRVGALIRIGRRFRAMGKIMLCRK